MDCCRQETQILRLNPMFSKLLRDQMLRRNMEFFLVRITAQRNDIHTVIQRPRNRTRIVCRRDKEHLAQVKRHIDIMVDKGVVLLPVQNFEQCGRRVPAKIIAEFIDLIEQQNRILGAGLPNGVDNPSRHGANIGAPVAADIRLIADAA